MYGMVLYKSYLLYVFAKGYQRANSVEKNYSKE